MTYVLHYAPDNASLIIRLALEQSGCAFETRLVDRSRSAQRDAAYLALNPHGLIPVLETPDGPLFETGAILLWLGDRHGGLGPQPRDAARGDYLKWLLYVSNTLHPLLRMTFYPGVYIGPDAQAQAQLRHGLRAQICAAYDALDALAGAQHRWFGTATGALDFYVAACLRWCALYPADAARDWFDLAHWPNLQAMCDRLDAQPCTAKLITAEGLGPRPFTAPRYPNPPEGSAT